MVTLAACAFSAASAAFLAFSPASFLAFSA